MYLNVTRDADTCSNWVSNVVIKHLKFNGPWRELSAHEMAETLDNEDFNSEIGRNLCQYA